MLKPKKLQAGDTIAILAPSSGLGNLFPHRLDNAIKALQGFGFKIKEFPTARRFLDGKAGTPVERARDLEQAFSDPQVKALICSIGGLSCNEILGLVDFKIIKNNPKIFCGYSDISLLHYAINKLVGLVTFYGPAAMTQFGEYPKPLEYTTKYFLKAVSETDPIGKITSSKEWTDEVLDWSQKEDLTRPRKLVVNPGHVWLKEGHAVGQITGGCLYSILQTKGTRFDIDYTNKILFIEIPEGQNFEKGEPLNYVDSQIMDLRNAGVFDKIKGLIVGRAFGYSPDERDAFKKIILKHIGSFNFPVLADIDIGHTDPMITIPLGVSVTLDSQKNLFSINESGVTD